jgi:outer membrane protein TolC
MLGKKTLWVFALLFLFMGRPAYSRATGLIEEHLSVGQEKVSTRDLAVISPSKAPAELTVQEAVTLALRDNVGFRSAVQNLLSARSFWYETKQRWELEIFGFVQRTGDGDTTNEKAAGAALSFDTVFGANFSVEAELDRVDSDETEKTLSASLNQPLLRGSGKASTAYEALRQARNAYRQALISYFNERQSLIENVLASYFRVLQQQRLVEIQDLSTKLAEQAVKEAQLRLEAGLIPEIDLTRAQLNLATAQNNAIGQRQSLSDAMDSLLLTLGLQVGDMSSLVTTVSYLPKGLNLDEAVAQALELQPQLVLSNLGIEDTEAALRISKNAALPSLDLFGSWNKTTNGATDHSWNLGLEWSIPIASKSLQESVKRAEWSLLVARQQRENLKQQIIADVRSQIRAAQTAQASVDIAIQSVELSKRGLYISQRMVEEGLASNRDLLDAQKALTDSESNLITSKINYYLATVGLQRAIGLDLARALPTERVPPVEKTPEEPASP